MKSRIIIITVVLTFCIAALIGCVYVYSNVHTYSEEVFYPATCLHHGVASSRCTICGKTQTRITELASGHTYTEWMVTKEPTEIENGLRQSFCDLCGSETSSFVESKTNFPKFYIYGDPSNISISNFVPIAFKYIENDTEHSGTAKIRLLERDTMSLPKPDYQIELYSDTDRNDAMNLILSEGWDETNTYTLHGNYLDITSARNYVSSVLWGDMVRSRTGSDELKQLTNGGATVGYPIIFYTNDVYKGIYTINISYNSAQYGMSENSPDTCAVVRAVGESDATLFVSEPVFAVYNDGFKFLAPTYSSDGHKTLMQSFIDMADFVISSSDEEFRKNLGKYLDVEAACDYLIFNTFVGGGENLANNCNYVTYDGRLWYPTLYQTYTGFGTDYEGKAIDADDHLIISRYNGKLHISTQSVLWQKFVQNFEDKILTRYKKLRKSVFTENRVPALFGEYITSIPTVLYEGDIAEFAKNTASRDISAQTISSWYSERVKLVDAVLY